MQKERRNRFFNRDLRRLTLSHNKNALAATIGIIAIMLTFAAIEPGIIKRDVEFCNAR